MKVELNEDGVLEISPETPVEAYALKHWCVEQMDGSDTGWAKILVHALKKKKRGE